MNGPPNLPNNASGDALRRLIAVGDDLSHARMVDFCFIFPERRQALAFAEIVDAKDLEICISYYERRDMWEAKVSRHMIPTYREITTLESALSVHAEFVGGEADGWGCMKIDKKS